MNTKHANTSYGLGDKVVITKSHVRGEVGRTMHVCAVAPGRVYLNRDGRAYGGERSYSLDAVRHA